MTIYGKIENEQLVIIESDNGRYKLNGLSVYNPRNADFFNAGYKEVIYTDKPEELPYKKFAEKYLVGDLAIYVEYEYVEMTDEEKLEYDQKIQEEAAAEMLAKQAAIQEKAKAVQAHIVSSYNSALNEMVPYDVYYIKGMFFEKYSKAYVSLQDDLEAGVEEPVVNLSIYQTETALINLDMTFEEFKPLYRAVKVIALHIEKQYQTLLANMTTLLTKTDLAEIDAELDNLLSVEITLPQD